jgi:hypothetical protein
MAAPGLAFQVLVGAAAAQVQLVVMHPVPPVPWAQMVVTGLRHQLQAHQLHALVAAVVVATTRMGFSDPVG